jgi:FtsH-binding integral membrane protein
MSTERAQFIQRTYMHLAGAILAFIGLEYFLLNVIDPTPIVHLMLRGGQLGWLVVLVAFMAVSAVARMWAQSEASPGVQYLGLGLYVVAEAIIFLPLLFIATHFAGGWGIVYQAGILTLAVFGGLTLTVFMTGKDFSFLQPIVFVGCLLALGIIIAGALFGFTLGLFFCVAMVVLISACILVETSNLAYHYRPSQHVAAALALFASVAILFWYILQILMELQNNRN